MPTLAFALAISIASVPQAATLPQALPMPPPPAGMKQLPALVQTETEPPDDPEVSKEVEEESAELEEMRAAEEAALDPQAKPAADVRQAIQRLGVGNPLRSRMEDALGPMELGEVDADTEHPELPLVTDLNLFDVKQLKDRYDIPIEMQPLVAQYIRFFQGAGRKWFRKWVSRSTRYIPVMQPILEQKKLPKDTVYLAMIESGFSARAYSWAHASGPWQFISGTGRQYGLKQDFWVDERRDPIKATFAASAYLSDLHRLLGDWYLAWASYNAGDRKVRRLIQKRSTKNFWELSVGRGLARETKHYVPKLIASAIVSKNLKAFGFQEEEFEYLPPLEFDEVLLTEAADLEVLARAAETDMETLQDLNPELKRWCTPPASEAKPYRLRVPRGSQNRFTENYAKVPKQERLAFKIHMVRRGDTLSQIAARYQSAPEAIMRMNGLRSVRALRLNTQLVIPVPTGLALKSGRADAVLERQVARARRSGVVASRPEDEIPAGTQVKSTVTGPIKTEVVDGRTRLTYGVQAGDSLWTIGQRFNCSVEDMRRWNGLSRRNRGLQVGTVLTLWPGDKAQENAGTVIVRTATATPPTTTGSKKTHLVAAGESLWTVAQRYGVSVEDLKRWNNIRTASTVHPGQELTLQTP